MVKYFCDRCGKEISGQKWEVQVMCYDDPLMCKHEDLGLVCEECKDNLMKGEQK